MNSKTAIEAMKVHPITDHRILDNIFHMRVLLQVLDCDT